MILEVHNVSKTYGKGEVAVHAIKDVSLTVKEGELVLVVGPSGSGKTTLLLLCGTLLRPDTGTIVIDGLNATSLSESQLPSVRLKKIGFVFQQFNLLSGFSALENIEVVPSIGGTRGKRSTEIAQKALESVGLGHRANHLPEQLSGGEKQRVAIARAAVNDPKLIIADEPTGNLDSKTGADVIELIRGIVKSGGKAALVASHDSRIEGLADSVLNLEDGMISK